jgi:hypothetical protein
VANRALTPASIVAVVVLASSCAASREDPQPVDMPPSGAAPGEADLEKMKHYLDCERRSTGSLAASNRMEACRVFEEFERAAAFELWPETGAETWIGRWHDCPHPTTEVAQPGHLLLVRLRISSFDLGPEALRLLPIDDVLPYSVRSLALVSPRERPGCTELVEALAAGQAPPSPQLARQLTATDPGTGEAAWLDALFSSPSAIARTRGVSVLFHDVLGRDPHVRQARDGRMLMVSGGSAFELWRIPSPGGGAQAEGRVEAERRVPRP